VLVLTRRAGQRIRIGEDVTVVVVGIDGAGQVRLGIEAPRSTQVLREELYQALAGENLRAAAASDPGQILGGGAVTGMTSPASAPAVPDSSR
jgi:carbon storage regulator